MRKVLGNRCVWGLCGLLAVVGAGSDEAQAGVSSDLSGSVLVFPKVMFNDGRDTIIQISNTQNTQVHVHCYYVNAAPLNPALPVSEFNPRRWQVTDFSLWLTRQQPTHWVVGTGRVVNPFDDFESDGAGIDPGAIPPVPLDFEGELKCVQIDSSGNPLGGNALQGQATLRNSDGDVTKYNAYSILANSGEVGDDSATINLATGPDVTVDGIVNEGYGACPNTLLFNHFSGDTSIDMPTGGTSEVNTTLTLVPCSQNFEELIPEVVSVQFDITNEFEEQFSGAAVVDCWFNEEIAALGSIDRNGFLSETVIGTPTAFTRITPADEFGGVIGVAEQSIDSSYAAWNLQAEGDFYFDSEDGTDRWVPTSRLEGTRDLPEGPVVDTVVIRKPF